MIVDVDENPLPDNTDPEVDAIHDGPDERLRAAVAIRAVLALPSWPTDMDRTRHMALTTALSRLEAGDDLADALAAVRDLLPTLERDS